VRIPPPNHVITLWSVRTIDLSVRPTQLGVVGSIDHARVEMSISPRGTVKPATRAKRAAMRVDVAQQGKFLPELRDKLLTFDIELPDGQAGQSPATGRLCPIEGRVGPDLGFRRGAIGPGIRPRGATERAGRPGSRVVTC
jgi:hypothetical protein